MTCGSLFSGMGCADFGLSQAGFRHLWLCEIDKDCRRVLDARFPGVPVYNDVTKFPAGDVEVPDVVWLSPPCQDLSVAGKRAGLAGERSGLFYEAIDILRRFRDRGWSGVALMEQVPGLLSSHSGRDFADVLIGFQESGAYDVCWRILDSRWFGVPQRRRRVYLVADFGAERASEILFESEGLSGDSQTGQAQGEVPAPEAGEGAGGDSAIPIQDCRGITKHQNGVGIGSEGDPSYTIDSTGAQGVSYCIKGAAIGRKPEAGPQYGEILEGEVYTLQTNEVHAVMVEAPEVAPTLNASMAKGMNGQDVGALVVQSELYRWYRMDTRMDGPLDESPACLQAWGTGGNNVPMVLEEEPVVHPPLTAANDPSRSPQSAEITASVEAVHRATTIVRRLTPVECLRLQAMPDDWCVMPEGKPLFDSAIYRMAGNGVTASVARWLGQRVMEVLET